MWRAAPVATVVLAVALVAGVFFGVRTTMHWIYWNDPANRDRAIAGWMPPGYVAKSWDVPREVITGALGGGETGAGPRNLDRIARDQGRTVEELAADIEAAIAAYRAVTPPQDAPREPGARP